MQAIEKADSYVVPNLYPRIIEENGGVGMNADTGEDSTDYFYNFPANRVELWFYLESARFLHPVSREFYKERDVVREERRMRIESESRRASSWKRCWPPPSKRIPTANLPVGWASDIENLRVKDAEKFFAKYYVPANITIAIVGDVDPARMKALAAEYFGRLPKRPLPPPVMTVEPAQEGPRRRRSRIARPARSEFIAYHRPDQYDKDDPVFDVLSDSSPAAAPASCIRDMVRDKQTRARRRRRRVHSPAANIPICSSSISIPSRGHTAAENEKELDSSSPNLQKAEGGSRSRSPRVKTRTRAGLIRQLDSNAGLAQLLSVYYGATTATGENSSPHSTTSTK